MQVLSFWLQKDVGVLDEFSDNLKYNFNRTCYSYRVMCHPDFCWKYLQNVIDLFDDKTNFTDLYELLWNYA